MSCDNPCAYITEELKKSGFECSSIARKLFADPIIKSSFVGDDEENLESWLKKIGEIMKKVKCPIKFMYSIKYRIGDKGRGDIKFDVQITFKKEAEYDYKYPKEELKTMLDDYNKIRDMSYALVSSGGVSRVDITKEFKNYKRKSYKKDLSKVFE